MTLESYVQGFGCVPDPTGYEDAEAVLLPAPLDWGVGEVPGVALGPMAVLGASRFIETFDSELGLDPLDRGIATLDGLDLHYTSETEPLEQIRNALRHIGSDGKLPICIGGERTIVYPALQAARDVHGDTGVVAFLRRPGMLETLAGRQFSPATIGYRVSQLAPFAFLGPRFWSKQEDARVRPLLGSQIITSRNIELGPTTAEEPLALLPEKIHLSIDVGVLDPSVLPISGNIEPGGVSWFRLTQLIDRVFQMKNVVSIDVSGFAPTMGLISPSLVVAQLVLRCLGRAAQQSTKRLEEGR